MNTAITTAPCTETGVGCISINHTSMCLEMRHAVESDGSR